MTDVRRTQFRPMARTIIMLGSELITDEITAVLELVKNSYDAGSPSVRVAIDTFKDVIEVSDEGCGMSEDDIFTKWLAPGTAAKARKADGSKPRVGGRVTLGEKGIGRFAVHHLGHKLTLISKREEEHDAAELIIDWDQYEDPKRYLDEIENTYRRRPAPPGLRKGTIIRISGLKSAWPSKTVERLQYVLALFKDPFYEKDKELQDHQTEKGGTDPFLIELTYNGRQLNLTEPVQDLLSNAHYRVEGKVTSEGYFVGTLNGEEWNGPLHGSDLSLEQLRQTPCGEFRVRLFVVERSNRTHPLYRFLSKSPYYQGMLVYRDGFRVLPYGSPGVDWLGLDKRRIGKVGQRIGNSHFLGFVGISYEANPGLKDKTNREGMQENGEYVVFRSLLVALMNKLEGHRSRLLVDKERRSRPDPLDQQFARLLRRADLTDAAREEIRMVHVSYTKESRRWNEQFRAMSELTGVGLAAERMSHEFGFLIRSIRQLLGDIEQRGCSEEAANLHRYVTELERELKYLEPLYQAGRRRREAVDVRAVVKHVFFLFRRDFQAHHVDARITDESGDFAFVGNRGLLVQALINIIDNSVFWLTKVPSDTRRILVHLSPDDRSILIADSGPGIPQEDQALVFEPFFSTRGGRGLGLYIVRTALADAGHRIELSTDPGEALLGGAVFRLTLAEQEA